MARRVSSVPACVKFDTEQLVRELVLAVLGACQVTRTREFGEVHSRLTLEVDGSPTEVIIGQFLGVGDGYITSVVLLEYGSQVKGFVAEFDEYLRRWSIRQCIYDLGDHEDDQSRLIRLIAA